MRLESPLDPALDLEVAIHLGQLRVEVTKAADEAMNRVIDAVATLERDTADAFASGAAAIESHGVESVVATSSLFNLCTAVCMAQRAHERAGALRVGTGLALEELRTLVSLDLPAEMIPQEAEPGFTAAAGGRIAPELSTRTILAESFRLVEKATLDAMLSRITKQRLWGLHAAVLGAIADYSGPPNGDAKRLRHDSEALVRTTRDELRTAFARAVAADAATFSWALDVWRVLTKAEAWILDNRAALGPVSALSSSSERRDAALAYDAIRRTLSLLAGAWAYLRAWAVGDREVAAQMLRATEFGDESGTLDLRRSPLKAVSEATSGDVLEIAATVREMKVTPGGPAPRSVLHLGRPTSSVAALVPFTAVDSFGVQPETWLQVRGVAFPSGKDDLTGPVLQVRRVLGQQAAELSFADHLGWIGRHEFELRPAGLDIVAGRLANSLNTCAELGTRQL